jgi:hypothetical protein
VRGVHEGLLDDLLVLGLLLCAHDEGLHNVLLELDECLGGACHDLGNLDLHVLDGELEGLLLGSFDGLRRGILLDGQGLLEL